MSRHDSFDYSLEQYHAGVERLWATLGVSAYSEAGSKDIYTLVEEHIADLNSQLGDLHCTF